MWHVQPRNALLRRRWHFGALPAARAPQPHAADSRSISSKGTLNNALKGIRTHHRGASWSSLRLNTSGRGRGRIAGAPCRRNYTYTTDNEHRCSVRRTPYSLSSLARHSQGAVGVGRRRQRLISSDAAGRGGRDSATAGDVPDEDRVGRTEDGAALLRRMVKYIEEDPRAADTLGKEMGRGSGAALSAALDKMEFAVLQPSWRELRRVAFISAVPFVGFGMMDNAIMVVAGEYIDMTVGVAMGLSTMAAAALGNTVSDMAGVGLGGIIESLATKMGLPPSNLSRAQMLLRTTRIASLVGCAIGVMVGCLIGMFPLWFMPNPEVVEAVKRKEKVVGLVDAVVEEAASFLSAASATLFILDKEKGTLWARRREPPGTPNADAVQDLKIELNGQGAVSEAARTGEAVHVLAGQRGSTPSMLCMPVFGANGDVAGVVQVMGKKVDGKAKDTGFTAEDSKDLSALCSHISVALENIKRTDETNEVDLRETIALMHSYGEGLKQHPPFPQHRSTTCTARSTLTHHPSAKVKTGTATHKSASSEATGEDSSTGKKEN